MNRSRSFVVRSALLASVLLGTFATATAYAAPSARDVSDAEQDFAKARQLMAEGHDIDQACALFAESNRLDPGTGTLLNLAICHEKEGKLASSWSDYNDVLAQSKAENRADRVEIAQKKIDELAPKLSSLAFDVPAANAVPGLTLSVDGRDRDATLWSVEKYIDPGVHEVKATAPGKLPWSMKVTIGEARQEVKVPVPALEAAPAVVAAPVGADSAHARPARQERRPGRALAGWVTGGIGVAGLAVGTIFGVTALAKNSDSKSACANGCVSDTAYTTANRDAWVADVAIPVGAIAVGVGAYLILTAQGDSDATPGDTAAAATKPRGVHVEPTVNVGHGGGSMGLVGRF